MKEIKLTDKVMLITHSDFDGCVSAILIESLFKNITTIYTNFDDVNKHLAVLDYKKYDWVILTDIHPESKELLNNPKIILLDHHSSAKQFHDPQNNRFVITKCCGALVVKRFLERYFKVDLSKFSSLCYLADDFDRWIHNNKKSKMINELYYRYWNEKFKERFKDGDTRLTQDEIKYIRRRMEEFKAVWKDLEIYELPQINGCFIIVEDFLNDVCDKLIKEQGYNVVIAMNPKNKHISIRHNIPQFNMGGLLSYLEIGGGHPEACGFTEDDFSTAQERINMFVKILSQLVVFEERK